MKRPTNSSRSSKLRHRILNSTWRTGLAGIFISSTINCQIIGELQELTLASDAGIGGSGTGGSGDSSAASSSSSASSSSGVPIMADVACGGGTCPVGSGTSACCFDYYHSNSPPYEECVTGTPSTDTCNTAGGVNGYETRIECQLAGHCPPGTVCCGNLETIAGLPWYTAVSCAAVCNWPDTIVCDPMDANTMCPVVNDNGAMRQTACTATEFLPAAYAVCK